MTHERIQALYRGWVQGVGFRYTVCRLADDFEVTGWVRNLPDGRVELVSEGASKELDRFLDAIQRRMTGYIQEVAVTRGSATHEFSGFSIRR